MTSQYCLGSRLNLVEEVRLMSCSLKAKFDPADAGEEARNSKGRPRRRLERGGDGRGTSQLRSRQHHLGFVEFEEVKLCWCGRWPPPIY